LKPYGQVAPDPTIRNGSHTYLSKGYVLAYFDAVNRYYVAQEQKELLMHFQLPPNVWDNFTFYNEIVLEYQLVQAQEEIARLTAK
jgi:hypothetical protein